jgi:hypothetical protein
MFSQMSTRSGTITVIGRNRAFRPSGSSDRPRYPGFMVMKAPQVGSRDISSLSIVILRLSALTPSHTDLNYKVIREKGGDRVEELKIRLLKVFRTEIGYIP